MFGCGSGKRLIGQLEARTHLVFLSFRSFGIFFAPFVQTSVIKKPPARVDYEHATYRARGSCQTPTRETTLRLPNGWKYAVFRGGSKIFLLLALNELWGGCRDRFHVNKRMCSSLGNRICSPSDLAVVSSSRFMWANPSGSML
jgi:hypothetical protein